MDSIPMLAELTQRRNAIDREIGAILGRPVHAGHFGEYVASQIFAIDLHTSATHKGSDGIFREGPLAGRDVNIKYYTRGAGLLDMTASRDPAMHPDVYLVLTGPKSGAVTSRNMHAFWTIAYVYLFKSLDLLAVLNERGVGVGVATSVRKHLWEAAEIFPKCRLTPSPLPLRIDQLNALKCFAPVPNGE